MDASTRDLPPPTPEALETSERLAALIEERIALAGGWIDFSEYMRLALYEPGLGYYSGGSEKLGPAGDFVTAPELSPALAMALAELLAEQFPPGGPRAVLELGAGSGRLAEQLLVAFDARGAPLDRYLVLETSAELRTRQAERLRPFGARVAWLDRLPDEPLDGAIVANEVADALPVSCFVKRDGRAVPLGVTVRAGRFAWAEGGPSEPLAEAVEDIEHALGAPLPDGFRSEVCLLLPPWIASLAALLRRGSITLIDYGLVRREYYHPSRREGTLICHYRHRAHDDPFLYPGLQDISAWVDFSACAAAAVGSGLDVAGFTTQAHFLLARLADAFADGVPPFAAGPRELAALKTLLLPGEMGERFKVMLLTKELPGLELGGRDLRDRL
ncbi:MAG TPA: SAM-dependent methyltransferase [Gammaproteobacteria bacterium]